MGTKFKMPSVEELYATRTITLGKKKDPVWVYLEQEMQANKMNKPYNEKVGQWLKFLKDLRYHYFQQRRRKYKQLMKEVGPSWYYEFSFRQKIILRTFSAGAHEDMIEINPNRTKKALKDLGITLKFSDEMLLRALMKSGSDSGLFFWHLYNFYYKTPPCEIAPKYDLNSMLMMSALVFIDLEECKKELRRVMECQPPPPPKPKKPPMKFYQPNVKFGEYLQKMYVPLYSNHPSQLKKDPKPRELVHKIKLRSDQSYERLIQSTDFIEKRLLKCKQEQLVKRECNYKFWEPPSNLRNTDPKMAAYNLALKMFKEKARARHSKLKPPHDNIQCLLGTITYTGGHPRYIIQSFISLATGYIPHNGGYVKFKNEFVIQILGYYLYPRAKEERCDSECNCLRIHDKRLRQYVNEFPCRCGHSYDLERTGKVTEIFFHPPTKWLPLEFDKPKIYRTDEWEEFVRCEFDRAMASDSYRLPASSATISVNKLKESELLKVFLAELANTSLIIPHLPKANLLHNLQELVRRQVKGKKIKKRKHKKMLLKSMRRWNDLSKYDLRAKAYFIPLNNAQRENFDFSYRPMIQRLFLKLLHNFENRNRKRLCAHTRLFWSTMKADMYPSKGFSEVFFTYIPGRPQDTYVLRPFVPSQVPAVAKTCPLNK